jgi:OmcA/MtrC family decaheme c-type cytochrome
MIHGIHGSSKRTYPFTHDNTVIGAFGKDGILGPAGGFTSGSSSSAPIGTPSVPFATTTAVPAGTPLGSDATNYAAEVAYPAVGLDCNGCHVNDSWKQDRGPIGAVVGKPLIGAAVPLAVDTNPLNWLVITPRAATCTSCHDSQAAISHVVGVGGASFGNASHAQAFQVQESCVDCHGPGRPFGVDAVHK